MTRAWPQRAGWQVDAACPVGALDTWLDRLRTDADGGAVALGVDLPLGLPREYAQRHVEAADFIAFLRQSSPGIAQTASCSARPDGWVDFFTVSAALSDISPHRPFYPTRGIAGMTRAAHAASLGLDGPAGLSRLCDRATAARPAGAPLFWTLGANQTGKAAITAWRDVLLPALASVNPPRLWPFEGGLHDLLTSGAVVIAETYPAESMRQRGLSLNGSKRRQTDRAALATAITAALADRQAVPSPALAKEIESGFGADASGEDRFDSLLGLLGLLAVLDGTQPDFIPDDPWVRRWEGWVLGQTHLPVQP
jgi:hypothetical protein